MQECDAELIVFVVFDLSQSLGTWKMGRKMNGVVLWSDKDHRKAVIWCEDHGDLAFCDHTDPRHPVMPDAGDWVQFEITQLGDQRRASNLTLIDPDLYPSLRDLLRSADAGAHQVRAPAGAGDPPGAGGGAKIIPLMRRSRAQCEAVPRRRSCRG